MRPYQPEQASQSVQRLNHRGNERRIGSVAWKDLADGKFELADEFLGLLFLLIGHVEVSSVGGPKGAHDKRRG
jgi:hypothetical protein